MAGNAWMTGIALAAVLTLGGVVPATAQEPPAAEPPARALPPPQGDDYLGWHWRMMEDGWHSGFGYGHWAFSLLFWVLIVGAIVLALRSGGNRGGGGPPRSPREILDERYARGEIDQAEYRRRREDLEGPAGGSRP